MIVRFKYQIPNSWVNWEHLDSVVTANKNLNQEMVGPPQGFLREYVNILCMLKSLHLYAGDKKCP